MSRSAGILRALSAAALLVVMTTGASPVAAASCRGASHKASLTNGVVSPSSGDTATKYKFKVTYSDNAGCVPASVTVTVAGVGDFAMSASGGSGTSYQRQTALPVGTFAYSFTAISGTGPGREVVTLASVSPSKIQVLPEPKPSATAKPTPAATPRPTVKPKPAATPKPTKAPSSPSPAVDTVLPTATTAPTARSPRASSSPREVAAVIGGSSTNGPLGALAPPSQDPSLPWLIAWLAATVGGLLLFYYLGRNPQLEALPVAAEAPSEPPAGSAPHTAAAPRPHRQARDESQLPRWLRPSVQAARYATPGRPGPDE